MISGSHITQLDKWNTAWEVSKDGVISGLYFPVFGLNSGKYGPEITPYLDTSRNKGESNRKLPKMFGDKNLRMP